MNYRIISIGALGAHPLWDEKAEVRADHATTTLVSSDDAHILVDPSLPADVLTPRLAERANLMPDQITHVFLTSFHPIRRRGLLAFENAQWLILESERETIGVSLVEKLHEAKEADDQELIETLTREIAIMQRCTAAPDSLATDVDLFPLPGNSAGTCGLLLTTPKATVLICGDAVPTVEHLEEGKVLPHGHDIEKARESFTEAVEIADLLILGRDNIVLNPLRRPF